MAFYADLGTKTQVADGDHIRAVGWLSDTHAFPQSDVPPAFAERLTQFARLSPESTKALHWPRFFGGHTCELCPRKLSRRGGADLPEGWLNFGVPAGDILFVAPELIVHYVQDHHYAPPPDFIAAVLTAPLPGTPEYLAAIKQFL
jgi:hypothetical protein